MCNKNASDFLFSEYSDKIVVMLEAYKISAKINIYIRDCVIQYQYFDSYVILSLGHKY